MALTIYLLLFFAEVPAKDVFEAEKGLLDDPQFWAIITMTVVFVLDILRRMYLRRIDKQDAEKKLELEKMAREQEKAERIELQETAKKEREEIAKQVEEKLILHYEREKFEQEKNSRKVIDKLREQDETVKSIDEKIVTLTVADEHKTELKDAIKENTQAAHDAFEIANTINEKLEKMSEAGILNKEGEKASEEIDAIEQAKEENKSGSVEPDK